MTSKIALTGGSLLIVGVAVVTLAVASPKPTSAIRLSGSAASLKRLSEETKKCGFSRVKFERIDKVLMLTVQVSGPSDRRFECLMGWVFAHPEMKVRFIGNEAYSNESKR